MRAEDIVELLRAQPFTPLRIHMTDGRTYDINHPELVVVFRTFLDIHVPSRKPGIMDHMERCALLHIVRVEHVERESTQPNN